MLKVNYRAHEALVTLSSKMFYNGEVVAAKLSEGRNFFCDWNKLPKKVLIFLNVKIV